MFNCDMNKRTSLGELHFGPKLEQPLHQLWGSFKCPTMRETKLADVQTSPPPQLGELHSGPKHLAISTNIYIYSKLLIKKSDNCWSDKFVVILSCELLRSQYVFCAMFLPLLKKYFTDNFSLVSSIWAQALWNKSHFFKDITLADIRVFSNSVESDQSVSLQSWRAPYGPKVHHNRSGTCKH